ncbi:unnamed protein product, partial [Didymodactylos carnosus]
MDNKGATFDERGTSDAQGTSDEVGMPNEDIEIREPRTDSTVDLFANIDKSTLDNDVHIIPPNDLYSRFHTDSTQGLTNEHAEQAQMEYGLNKITLPPQRSYIMLFVLQAFAGFNLILLVAGIFAFLAWKPFGEPNPSITNLSLGVVLFLIILTTPP